MADREQDIRVPKGILKNKYGSSSSSRDSADNSDKHMSMGSSYGGSSSGWDSQVGMMGGGHGKPMPIAPVPAPQHGMNMPNPVLDPVMRGIKDR